MGKNLEKLGIDFVNPLDNLQMDVKIPKMPENALVSVADHFEKSEKYQEKSLEILQQISENTANLYALVELISNSNDKQDEIIGVLIEILSIAKAREKKEAESLLKKAISKINDCADTGESVIKLVGWATTIYSMIEKILP